MMMIDEYAAAKLTPNTSESKLARSYRKAKEDIEAGSRDLIKLIRAERVDGHLVPVFAPEAEAIQDKIENAEKRKVEARRDIEKLHKVLNGRSLVEISGELHRARLKISNVEHDSRIVWKHALIENHEMTPLEAQELEVVKAAFRKRDNLKAKYEPLVADLQDTLTKANEILSKYS